MTHMLAATRLTALLLISIVLVPVALLVTGVGALGGRAWRPGVLRLQPRFTSLWSRICLVVMGVSIERPPALPAEIGLITANHLSYLDVIVIAAIRPGRFVAKREIASWPVVGVLARAAGTLFLEQARKRAVVALGEELRATIRAGMPVIFFPEGRISEGVAVERFHGALLWPAVEEGAGCLPLCLHYAVRNPRVSPRTAICWASDIGFFTHFWGVLRIPRIRARVRQADDVIRGDDRKQLAVALHTATVALFEPIRA